MVDMEKQADDNANPFMPDGEEAKDEPKKRKITRKTIKEEDLVNG